MNNTTNSNSSSDIPHKLEGGYYNVHISSAIAVKVINAFSFIPYFFLSL